MRAVIYKDGVGKKRAAVCVRLSNYLDAMIKKRNDCGVLTTALSFGHAFLTSVDQRWRRKANVGRGVELVSLVRWGAVRALFASQA